MTLDSDFQEFLDAISECFIVRDFHAWKARILLPFSLVTRDGPVVLHDDFALRRNFDDYLKACDAMSLDKVYRRPISLEDCADGTWIGTYETNLMRKGQRATAPYTSSAMLHPSDQGLRMSSILNARGHHEWTGKKPGDTGG